MYFLSKLLPLLVLPLGISIILISLKIYFKFKRTDILGLGILYFFSVGIVSEKIWEWLEYPWQRVKSESIENGDAIVVLSGGGRVLVPGRERIYEWTDPDRFFAGIDLFNKQKSKKLIFTGGSSPLSKNLILEGNLYAKEAIKYGIPSNAISVTSKVFNTTHEAKEVYKLLEIRKNKPLKKVILVTSAFHMQRAKKEFEREGMIVIPFPVDFKTSNKSIGLELKNPYNWLPNSASLNRSSRALREFLGRFIYMFKHLLK